MTRIAILGGGLSGRLTALQLAEQGVRGTEPVTQKRTNIEQPTKT